MLTDFINKYPTATISLAQTTFMHLQVQGGLFKVDFNQKIEAKLKPGRTGTLSHYTNHPLLLYYNEGRATVYINSAPVNPESLFNEICAGISTIFSGWSDWRSPLFGSNNMGAEDLLKQNLIEGSGILLSSAPTSIAKEVVTICEKHSVTTKTFGSLEVDLDFPPQYSILFIGSYYVIAKGFQVYPL